MEGALLLHRPFGVTHTPCVGRGQLLRPPSQPQGLSVQENLSGAHISVPESAPHTPGAIAGCPSLRYSKQLQAQVEDASLSALTQRQAAHYGLERR